ncbi:MAG: hypothetical protein AB1489_20995, partial [Acidobacteriota bacterium]
FDCCHSGTITRDIFGMRQRLIEPDLRPISELPPSPINPILISELSREVGKSGWLPLSEKYVLIAACRDKECAFEYNDNGNIYGALSYFLSKELNGSCAGTTYRDIFEQVSLQLNREFHRQHPQMEGHLDRELLGINDINPMKFVLVKQRYGNEVVLAAGAAHGLTINSQWAIYPSQTKQINEVTKLGLIKITQVQPTISKARIISEVQPNSVAKNSRAVAEMHAYGEMHLSVDINVPQNYQENSIELLNIIEKSPSLSATKEAAKAIIYLLTPRKEVSAQDYVPQLKKITEPIWAVVGQDGQLLMPIQPIAKHNAIAQIRDNLEKIARYQYTLALRNENSKLKSSIEFAIKRQTKDKQWVLAAANNNGGQIVFQDGEYIALKLTNNYTDPVYIAILDFGITGSVNILYPPLGANEELKPGISVEIGVREDEKILLYIPEHFWQRLDSDENCIGGTETFKLIATTHPTDFRLLIQDSISGTLRSIDEYTFPLEQLLSLALGGIGTREIRPVNLPTNEEWITIERSFFLQSNARSMGSFNTK